MVSTSWLLNCFVLKTSVKKTKQLSCQLVDQLVGTMFIERSGYSKQHMLLKETFKIEMLPKLRQIFS